MAKEKIVVIDDSPIVRKLAELALEEEGYKVYTAEDGEEGLRICEEVRPAVILVDFIMPRISGYQFCEAARDNELLKDIPIILITGKGEDVGKKFAEKFGVVDYFIKPFKSEVLVEKVNAIIFAQKEQAEEVAGVEPEPAVFESSDILVHQTNEEKPFYGATTTSPEPAMVVEPVDFAGDLIYSESLSEGFKFKEEEMLSAGQDTLLTPEPMDIQPLEPVTLQEEPAAIQPLEPVTLPEEPAEKPVETVETIIQEESFIQPADTDIVVKPESPVALPDFAFTTPNEMPLETEPSFDEPVKEAAPEPPGIYEFGSAQEFTTAHAFDSGAEKTFEYQAAGTVDTSLDSVIHTYFNDELSRLIEKNMEDVLRRYGIIKDSAILLSGDLGSITCIEVLKLLDTQRLTGKFSAYSRSGSAEIYFKNGEVVYALTSKQGGTLTSKRVAIIKKGSQAGEVGDRTAEGIIDAVITAAEFKDGEFFFEKMDPPKALSDMGKRSNIVSLVLQGLRMKGADIAKGSDLNESSIPVRAISDGAARNTGMNSQEIDVFLSVDGTNSIAEIGASSDLGIVEVSRILFRLEKAGIVAGKRAC
jgi:CheY-like chemotaxis protein